MREGSAAMVRTHKSKFKEEHPIGTVSLLVLLSDLLPHFKVANPKKDVPVLSRSDAPSAERRKAEAQRMREKYQVRASSPLKAHPARDIPTCAPISLDTSVQAAPSSNPPSFSGVDLHLRLRAVLAGRRST